MDLKHDVRALWEEFPHSGRQGMRHIPRGPSSQSSRWGETYSAKSRVSRLSVFAGQLACCTGCVQKDQDVMDDIPVARFDIDSRDIAVFRISGRDYETAVNIRAFGVKRIGLTRLKCRVWRSQ